MTRAETQPAAPGHLGGRKYAPCGSRAGAAIGDGIQSAVLLLGRDEHYLPLFGVVLGAPAQAIGATIAH